ncbi:MAG: ATP-binding protein [Deltaproteobacteria bacterium]|nr:ATP-binding protein [Deltaproteobacteria bacterium]
MALTIARSGHENRVRRLLKANRVVAILGARQVGKTTLARAIAARSSGPVSHFDLQDPRDLAVLESPTLALEPLTGLVILDEIQLRPDLFSVLRVLADRPKGKARFLILGSAAPELVQRGAESLAGRIAFHELGGFDLGEVGAKALDRLWTRGGLPRAYLAKSEAQSAQWRRDFIRAFVERDLPRLGVGIPPRTMERFFGMLAHYHAQVFNSSELARAFGVSHTTVRSYLDRLEGALVVEHLHPWAENVGKRLVKAPKVYLSDSGLLHSLLGIERHDDLLRHPKVGASWEGFLIAEVRRAIGARREQCFFWATHAGAELDLLVVAGDHRYGFEIKRTDAPRVTPSMRSALEDLGLRRLDVIHAGDRTFALAPRIRAVAAARILEDLPAGLT